MALGHTSIGPGGEGISVCFAAAGQEQDNDYASLEESEQARLITHEASHFFLQVNDTGGYFGSECGETPINTSCLRGTREDCGTSGRPSAERFDTADAYACFVHFLRLAADEETGEQTLEERFRESRGEALVISAHLPDPLLGGEQLFGASIYINTEEGTEHFALEGVPEASGFSYQWSLEVEGERFELRADDFGNDPGAIVPDEVKVGLLELVESRGGESREEGEAAPAAVRGTIVCQVQLFTDAPESDQVEERLEVSLETQQPGL